MKNLKQRTLIVIASTYPRWANDKVPNFVENFVNRMSGTFRNIRVIVPHYKGAKRKERPQSPGGNVRIARFRYFVPFSQENIAYGEFKKDKLYPLKTLLYIWSELCTTLWACIRGRQPVINAHWLIPQGFVAVLLKPVFKCKVVISIHGADVFTLNGGTMRKVKRFTLKRADAVIVNSSATKAVCEGLYDREYPIIPMGVDTTRFSRPAKRTANERFELLFVGRVVEEKGLDYLCEAVNILKKQAVPVHLNIVGDGAARADVAKFVKKHKLEDAITLVGWVQQEDLAEYYGKADAFVGPSIEIENGWKEAFGVVFAEASACGLPVITTSTGGIKDIIKHEVNGLVVPQRNAEAIAEAVQRLQKDPKLCQKLGDRGVSYIAENFSWDVIAAKYEQIFKNL
ncbi:MAG TPA: glycosyltransferase [Candidatus Saccharimonadales bacterium]|nr:glycosyltransferase [Candidatus Saccharimonadales bacterium]